MVLISLNGSFTGAAGVSQLFLDITPIKCGQLATLKQFRSIPEQSSAHRDLPHSNFEAPYLFRGFQALSRNR